MITGAVLDALALFSLDITAFEITGRYDSNRRWVKDDATRDFCISGSIQPLTDKELKVLPEGDVSAGDMVLYTEDELKIADTSELTGLQPDQTYIKENDEVWRVKKLMDWDRNSGFRKYIIEKFVQS